MNTAKLDEMATVHAKTTFLENSLGWWEDGKEAYLDGAVAIMSRLETLLNTMKCTRYDELLCKERTLSTQEIMSELLNK